MYLKPFYECQIAEVNSISSDVHIEMQSTIPDFPGLENRFLRRFSSLYGFLVRRHLDTLGTKLVIPQAIPTKGTHYVWVQWVGAKDVALASPGLHALGPFGRGTLSSSVGCFCFFSPVFGEGEMRDVPSEYLLSVTPSWSL